MIVVGQTAEDVSRVFATHGDTQRDLVLSHPDYAGRSIYSIGTTLALGDVIPPEAILLNGPVDLVAYAAARRWDIIETTRLDVGGCSVPTDKTTRDTLTAGYVKASANPEYQIADWKVGPGQYVTLTAAEIIVIADAVEAFVQLMFSRNRIADEAIESGAATTTAHVDSILAGEAP